MVVSFCSMDKKKKSFIFMNLGRKKVPVGVTNRRGHPGNLYK